MKEKLAFWGLVAMLFVTLVTGLFCQTTATTPPTLAPIENQVQQPKPQATAVIQTQLTSDAHAPNDLDIGKQDKIVFSTRAPTSADKGRFWVKYTANSDTTMTLYIRHPNTGTWRSVNVS